MLTSSFNLPLAFNLSTYVIVLIAIVCIIGDYLVTSSRNSVAKAAFDNATHALIGALSWFFVCVNLRPLSFIFEVATCAILASIIDLDHFLAAKSLSLKDATSLPKRPPLHCTTLPLVICFVLLALCVSCQMDFLKKPALIILTAFLSHHIRDATRRGFWFYPFFSTRPISYFSYILLSCALPVCVLRLSQCFNFPGKAWGSLIQV